MKHLFSLLLLAMLSLTAVAQEPTFEKSYFRASIGGSGIYMQTDADVKDDSSWFPGGAAGLFIGWRLSDPKYKHCAMYLEAGGSAQYGIDNEDGAKTQLVTMSIPVDFVYKFRLGDNPADFSRRFILFFGANPKFNLLAQTDMDKKVKTSGPATFYHGHKVNSYSYKDVHQTIDLLETGEEFQMGANVGFGYEAGRFQIAYKFIYDFMPFQSSDDVNVNINTMSHVISLSYVLH